MADRAYPYIVVGGGLAGAHAVQGVRMYDRDAPVLLIGRERHLPYDRPSLSKNLWIGEQQVDAIFVNDRAY